MHDLQSKLRLSLTNLKENTQFTSQFKCYVKNLKLLIKNRQHRSETSLDHMQI